MTNPGANILTRTGRSGLDSPDSRRAPRFAAGRPDLSRATSKSDVNNGRLGSLGGCADPPGVQFEHAPLRPDRGCSHSGQRLTSPLLTLANALRSTSALFGIPMQHTPTSRKQAAAGVVNEHAQNRCCAVPPSSERSRSRRIGRSAGEPEGLGEVVGADEQ
jgi:hypothetical protein